MSEARATALPGRSRHGFYAGQVSHLDQADPAHGAVHTDPPIHSDRTNDARPEQEVQPSVGHFDERYGTGGRFVPRRAEPAVSVEAPAPPEPAPEPVRSSAITPEMVFRFGPKEAAPVDIAAPTEPLPVPAMPSPPEPDPISRSFGTWETPPVPTPRPDFVAAAQQAERERAANAAVASQLDLTTVRDLFPEPPLDGEKRPGPTAEPAPNPVQNDRLTQTEEKAQRGVEPGVALTQGPDGAADRSDQAAFAGNTGQGNADADGPAGPIGPVSASADTGGEPVEAAPPTKQSRYWATGAHASAFVGAWMGGVPAFVGPLVVWLARKDNDPFAAEHGRNALNFNLSVIVYVLGLIIVSIITFGLGLLVTIPGFIALGLAWFAFTLVGTIKAASSETYTYPLTIRFVR